MKYIDEYRDKKIINQILKNINAISKKNITLMEVCGSHTMAIHKFGIYSILPKNIKLLSGPGCPVCVTDIRYIDQAIAYSKLNDVIITSFGDLIRVPGSTSSLDKQKANGADIRIVYSTLEAIEIARSNKNKKIIFLGIGFETTAPTTAVAILKAKEEAINNFYLFAAHKIMPPAMSAIIDEGVKIDGYICPGHVSVITGAKIYSKIADKYKLGCVISGFEPVDIMQTIYMLVKQIEDSNPKVEIQYKRVVKPEGNIKALGIINEVFELKDEYWRGLGILKNSGLKIREKYSNFNCEKMIDIKVEKTKKISGCICGDILRGIKTPLDCRLFAKKCSPSNPVGACMVSTEGACSAYYKYKNI